MGNTPIQGPHSGPKEALVAFAKDQNALQLQQVFAFFDELYNQNILDGFMIAVQSAVETNNWRSDYWGNRLNPGGLGLLGGAGGGVDQDLGYTWKSGQDAARAMLIHHCAYVGIMPDEWKAWIPLDPRYAVAKQAYSGSVKTWSDYGNGRWAADPNYYTAIMNREKWVRQFDTGTTKQATGDDLASLAEKQKGKPYVYGHAGPNDFDCSGLVAWCYQQVTGTSISHDSHAQFNLGNAVQKSDLARGDLLFYDTANGGEQREGNTASHVGIYLGNNQMINALNPQQGVLISDPFSTYFAPLYLGARRVLPKGTATPSPQTNWPAKPPILDKWLSVQKWIPNRNGKKARYIFIHIQEGSNPGTLSYFNDPSVKASSTVLAGRNGEIWRLVNEKDGPWTNGDVKSPLAVAKQTVLAETNDPNEETLSIETEGFTYAPNNLGWPAQDHPQKQLDAVVWQCLDWMSRYNIPVEHVFPHYYVNTVDRRGCPGDVYYQYVVNRLKGMQVTPPEPEGYDPMPVPNFDGTQDVEQNGVLFHAQKTKVTITTDNALERQWASFTAGPIVDPLKKGSTVDVLGWVNGETQQGEMRWWIVKDWGRLWVGDTQQDPDPPKLIPPILPDGSPDNKPDVPDFPNAPIVRNGHAFYPVGEDGKGRPVRVTKDANLRKYAAGDAEIVGSVKTGDTPRAFYWVRGDNVDDEEVWWVLESFDGPRLWAGATEDRPY